MISSNNLYTQLLELAYEQKISLSEDSQRSSAHSSKPPDQFTVKMKGIKDKIEMVRDNNEQILNYRGNLTSTSLPQHQAQIFERIRILCDQNYQLISSLKNELQEINVIVQKELQKAPDEPQTFSKQYHRQFLAKQIGSIVKQAHKINKIIQKYSINTSLKRIKALAPQLGEQEALEIAKRKNGFEQVIMSKTIGKASLKLKYRINDIMEKQRGILQLQKSVQQNLRLMNQIAFLVKQQGQMIDNVYQNVLQAKDYLGKAEKHLSKEKEKHKSSRKKMCCIILIGIIILAIIITPIVITVVKKNQNG